MNLPPAANTQAKPLWSSNSRVAGLTEATSNVGLVGACADAALPMRQSTDSMQMDQRARGLSIVTPSPCGSKRQDKRHCIRLTRRD